MAIFVFGVFALAETIRRESDDMTTKARTLRLPLDQAIAAHIEARRDDPDFRRRLWASIERNNEILERLAR